MTSQLINSGWEHAKNHSVCGLLQSRITKAQRNTQQHDLKESLSIHSKNHSVCGLLQSRITKSQRNTQQHDLKESLSIHSKSQSKMNSLQKHLTNWQSNIPQLRVPCRFADATKHLCHRSEDVSSIRLVSHCTLLDNESLNVAVQHAAPVFYLWHLAGTVDVQTGKFHVQTRFLSNCNDTLIANNENKISLNDTIDPDSILHDGALYFDHHAAGQKTILVVTFTSFTSMKLSCDRAFMSSAFHKELMGMLKQRWKFISLAIFPFHHGCNVF